MLNNCCKSFCLVLALCVSQLVCAGQSAQENSAPPPDTAAEDAAWYYYYTTRPTPPPTKREIKEAATAQNAVINYLGAPPRPVHFSEKLTYYSSSTVSVRVAIETAGFAGIPDLPAAPLQPRAPAVIDATTGPEYETAFQAYGNDMRAWRDDSETELRYRGNRAAVGLATVETRMFLSNMLLPLTLRQVGRYEPADIDGSFGSRMGHAFASIAVARSDSGALVPNYSKLIGTAGAAVVGRYYYSDVFKVSRFDANNFVERYIGYSVAADLATNVARELMRTAVRPDILLADNDGPASQEVYYPLSFGGKFVSWTESIYAPRHFISGGLIAGLPSLATQPVYPAVPEINSVEEELAYDNELTQYGAAEQLWRDNLEENLRYRGRRFIGGMSESETQGALEKLVLPTVLRTDPRYIPLGTAHSVGARTANAFAGLALTRMDSGRRVPNIPLLAGNVGAAFIAKEYYYPQLEVASLSSNQVLEKTIGFNLAGDLILNLVSECFPRRSF